METIRFNVGVGNKSKYDPVLRNELLSLNKNRHFKAYTLNKMPYIVVLAFDWMFAEI